MITFKDFLYESEILEETRQYLEEALIEFGGRKQTQFGQVVILAGGAGCYPKGTEFFTGRGWKKLEDYQDGDRVLTYDSVTGKAFMAEPEDYINAQADGFVRIKNRRVDFTTSLGHRHLTINEKTGLKEVKKTTELLDSHETLKRGNKRKLVTSFQYDGDTGIDMSDDMIRLKVAIFADGHFLPARPNVCRMSFKKERKIERFIELIEACNIEYRQYTDKEGFTRFEFLMDNTEKEFESFWYGCNRHQLEVIRDEILLWDGSIVNRKDRKSITSFCSTSEKSRDFAQFVFASFGYDTYIHTDAREGNKTCYSVYVNNCENVGISKNHRSDPEKTTRFEMVPHEGERMYCFTTSTGFFIVRQNGKIYVSGNSGKGFVVENMIGLQGKVLDVDALKSAAMKSPKIIDRVKKEMNFDLSKADLKNADDVFKIHTIISDELRLSKRKDQALYTSILSAHPTRKPNLIFDVTLKDLRKLQEISKIVDGLGYLKENIHIVWVVNDIEVARTQNVNRSRTVPDEILVNTHRGASMTVKDILDMGDKIKAYMDGFIYLAFNKAKVDSEYKVGEVNPKGGPIKAKAKSKGAYIKIANYITVKARGKPQTKSIELPQEVLTKLREYTPKAADW